MAIWPRFQMRKYRNDNHREVTLNFITYQMRSGGFTFDSSDFLVEINGHVRQINFTIDRFNLIQLDLMRIFEPIESRDH